MGVPTAESQGLRPWTPPFGAFPLPGAFPLRGALFLPSHVHVHVYVHVSVTVSMFITCLCTKRVVVYLIKFGELIINTIFH